MRIIVNQVWLLVALVTYACALSDFLQSIERTKIVASPGRHVCTTESVISRPVTVIQPYKKPVYTSRPRDCPNLINCPQYDVKYIPANRTVYQLQKYSKFEHSCCPGWTKSQKRQKGCMGPICKNGCGEFGLCVKPDLCQCRMGFAGDMCDTDIDECKGRDHGCTQICKNTAGSYMCACSEGFVLAADGRTCNFCFQCQKEYLSMMSMMSELQNELNLQTEKENLRSNMTKEIEELRQEVVYLQSKNTEKENLRSNMTEEIEELRQEVVYLQSKNREVEEMHTNTTSVYLELKSSVDSLTKENQELKVEIASLERNQSVLIDEMEVLKLAPAPTKTAPPTTTKSPPVTTATTTTTTTFPTTSKNPFDIQFDPVYMITSLSNQIGLMEEKLDLCSCVERRRP